MEEARRIEQHQRDLRNLRDNAGARTQHALDDNTEADRRAIAEEKRRQKMMNDDQRSLFSEFLLNSSKCT